MGIGHKHNDSILKGKVVLLTGGTGSFGQKFTEIVLNKYNPNTIRIFSRDELKQWKMEAKFKKDTHLRFFIGDVRDKERLYRAMNGVDIVVHAAALKHVPVCEYNPFEAIKTNIIGAQNIIESAIDNNVDRVIALSTDKAVNPINLYGATKLVAEKLFIQANTYSGAGKKTKFSCVRYGNVIGSRGSVIPLFLKQKKDGRITITDIKMSRFWITLEEGVEFVIKCAGKMVGGEVFVPKLPSANIMDIVKAVAPECKIEKIGIRPGEKLHEILINEDEVRQTREMEDMYIIQPNYSWWREKSSYKGKDLPIDFRYSSDINPNKLKIDSIKNIVSSMEKNEY
jgi:UDP-N-acetylglucosamine 4,6-dehydratase/5-epimerase